jgi:hypothetical protein
MKKITCNLSIGPDIFVNIENVIDSPLDLKIRSNGLLDANEHAAMHVITEAIRCLSSGKNIDFHFNPVVNEEKDAELIRCRWERNGRLRVGDVTDKKFMHAETTTEALARNRAFTCHRRLLRILPARRPIQPKPSAKPITVKAEQHAEEEAEQ